MKKIFLFIALIAFSLVVVACGILRKMKIKHKMNKLKKIITMMQQQNGRTRRNESKFKTDTWNKSGNQENMQKKWMTLIIQNLT